MADHDTYPLTVVSVLQQDEHGMALLLLQDDLGRQLEIPIGLCEVVAIQLALKEEKLPRPLTHDLLLSISAHLETPVDYVIIDDVSKGTFFARLILRGPDGLISIDCRPSDGIAVALRADTPILATDYVMSGEGYEE